MLYDLDLDFRISRFNGQLVWQGLGDYSGLASARCFSSKEEAEDDAGTLISHLFAVAAESPSAASVSSDARPLLSVVHSCEDEEFYLLAA